MTLGSVKNYTPVRLPTMNAQKAIEEFVLCVDLEEVWAALQRYLNHIGFDRAIFAHRDNVSEDTLHNHEGMIHFSSYGADLDRAVMERRLYMNSPTVRWAFRNAGWKSWADSADDMAQNRLSKEEEDVVRLTREMGLTAGWTYSVPFRPDARFRSVFGLAVPIDAPQSEADAILAQFREQLESVLLAFSLAVTRFQLVAQSQRLSSVQIKTLSLIAEGRTLAEVAELEGVHWRTIDKRLAASRQILAANNTVHAVLLAEHSGQLIVVRD